MPAGAGVTAIGGQGTGDSNSSGGDGVVASGGNEGGAGVMATGAGGGDFAGPGVIAVGAVASCCSQAPGVAAYGGDATIGGSDGIHAASTGTGNLAGSFTGDVSISGNLNVSGTKHFRIDDPLDPANRYLYHAALESSEVLNLYAGNAVLDAGGEAAVQLPDWFETLNRDFRYQLTAIGAPAPNLHVAQEIQESQFQDRRWRRGYEGLLAGDWRSPGRLGEGTSDGG
jgi:trimeric autotransporter adhesin